MQTPKILKTFWLFAILSIAGWATAQAQYVTNATYIGAAYPTIGDWGNAGTWSTGVVPGADVNGTTNVTIPFVSTSSSNIVTYGAAMSAAGVGGVTNLGVLNVNAGGFNCNGIFLTATRGYPGWMFANNANTAINVNGNLAITSNNVVVLGGGAHVTVSGSIFVGSGVSGGSGSVNSGSIGIMTNNGAFLNAGVTMVNPGNSSGPSGTSQASLLVINGGTNNLGTTTVKRSCVTSGFATLGTEGLIIYGGLVTMSNLNAGGLGNGTAGASYNTTLIAGGTVTNFGSIYINNATAGRPSRVLQTGGLFVVQDGVVNPNSTTAGSVTAQYTVSGGTNIVGGFYFGATNGVAAATVNFTDSGVIYVGSQGIASNGVVVLTTALNNGGSFGATADWTGLTTLNFGSGATFTFQAADVDGTPHNITLNGIVGGSSGNLNKTGGGNLLLNAANTYGGATLVNGGTLTLGSSGSLASPKVIVGNGSTFDVSALANPFTVVNNQTLSGLGVVTGAVAVVSGGTIDPGSNAISGHLTILGSVTETNGNAVNHFDLTGAPNPNNDEIILTGDLNVGGATNKIDITGSSLTPGVSYVLIQYGGNFDGTTNNFVVTTIVGGILTNDTTAKTIAYIPATPLRGPTNTVWIGNPANTNWDNTISTNWLIASSGLLDSFGFVTGDNVQFTDVGASNSPVNIVGTVSPNSIVVNSHSNYVFASTSGGLIGNGAALTVSGTGTLTVLTTNTYTGVTLIDGGTLEATMIANSLLPSSIGAASSDPATLVLTNGGELRYIGAVSTSTDHGISLNGSGGAIGVANGTTLTLNNAFSGSGILTKQDNGELRLNVANTTSGGIIVNNGTLTLANANAAGTGGITNNNGTTLKIASALTVPNVFYVNGAVTVDLNNQNGDTALDGAWVGSGTVTVINQQTNARTFTLGGNGNGGANMAGFSGTLNCGTNTGSFRFNDSGGNPNTGSTNMTINLGTGSATLLARSGGITIDIGTLLGGTSTVMRGRGSGSAGTLTYSIGGNNSDSDFSGAITNGPSGSVTALVKVGTGTLTLRGQSLYTGSTVISNGVLAMANNPGNGLDGSIGSSATIDVKAGAVLDATGETQYPGTLTMGASSTLRGNGTIRGKLDTSISGGSVAPGGGFSGSIGTLTVTGNITLGGLGTNWMKINRLASPNCDQLNSSGGSINYGGTLAVNNLGPRLQVGDKFTLFTNVSFVGGGFAAFALPPYYTWDTSQLTVNGSITVTGVLPLPKVTQADFSALASGVITLKSTNGIPNTSVSVITSTNLALPLSSWTTVTNTFFDDNGNLYNGDSFTPGGQTIYINPAQTPRFYILSTTGN